MKTTMLLRRLASVQLAALLIVTGGSALNAHAAKTPVFSSINLDSDILGVAEYYDGQTNNPWGLTTGTAGDLHVADENAGVATIYNTDGSLVGGTDNFITIPQATVTTGSLGTPTGIDENLKAILDTSDTNDFAITSGTVTMSAHYLSCTEDGAIVGYRKEVNLHSAVIGPNQADQSTNGAGYTGIALSWSGTSPTTLVHQLYAANFAQGKVDVFDSQFHLLTLLSGTAFGKTPPPVTTGTNTSWSPFNIHRVDYKVGKNTVRMLLVVYALHTAAQPMNDIPGPGAGYADLYTPEGAFVQRFVAPGGALNSPWGIAVTHMSFAKFGAPMAVLIGNHGNGQINAYSVDPKFPDLDGVHLGTLMDTHGDPLAFAYLWALHFGPKRVTLSQYLEDPADLIEDGKNLYFSAGIVEELRGLVGRIVVP
jgi:uncharacterized protein (TIGR03118 family)